MSATVTKYGAKIEKVSESLIRAFYARNDVLIRKKLSPLVGNDFTPENGFPELRNAVSKWILASNAIDGSRKGVLSSTSLSEAGVVIIEHFAALAKNLENEPLEAVSRHYSLKSNIVVVKFLTEFLDAETDREKGFFLSFVLRDLLTLIAISEMLEDGSFKP